MNPDFSSVIPWILYRSSLHLHYIDF